MILNNDYRNKPLHCGLLEMNYSCEITNSLCNNDCENCRFNNCG